MPKESICMTVALPAETAKKLRELVPKRKRSEFIAEAIEQRLMPMVYRQGRKLSLGVWSDADYPHLRTQEDVRRYIAELRDRDHWRRSTGERR